ncbi:MAG: penicillin acylase family protein, partial [Polynucleobacter sp.]
MRTLKRKSSLTKFLRYLIVALILLFICLVILAVSYWVSAKSNLSGTIVSAGLGQTVQIQFDENDVPHVKAKSQRDAYYTLGFLHATERSWQLEISRRLASGRLSEILGERTVSLDRFIRTLGIKQAAEKQFERYPAEIKQLVQAYADGV